MKTCAQRRKWPKQARRNARATLQRRKNDAAERA
jgi:hypothetical protein